MTNLKYSHYDRDAFERTAHNKICAYCERNGSMSYNGWRNYETWCMNMWLNSEPAGIRLINTALTVSDNNLKCGGWLKQELTPQLECELDSASVWCDLLHRSFDIIAWFEADRINARCLLRNKSLYSDHFKLLELERLLSPEWVNWANHAAEH